MSIFNLANANIGHGIAFDGLKKSTSVQFSKDSKNFDNTIKQFIEFAKNKKKELEDKRENVLSSISQKYRVTDSLKVKFDNPEYKFEYVFGYDIQGLNDLSEEAIENLFNEIKNMLDDLSKKEVFGFRHNEKYLGVYIALSKLEELKKA